MKQNLLSTKPAKSEVLYETFSQRSYPMKKTIRLSRIKISLEMQSTMPRSEKLAAKYDYAKNQMRINKKYGRNRNIFQSKIILDKRNNLLDGYTSYLIAKMFGIKKAEVVVKEK